MTNHKASCWDTYLGQKSKIENLKALGCFINKGTALILKLKITKI